MSDHKKHRFDYYEFSDKIDVINVLSTIIMAVVGFLLVGLLWITLTDIVCKATDFISKVGG